MSTHNNAVPAADAPEIGEVTWQQAADAIENLDDYARMMVGVDPSGPRETLYRFLEQAKAALAAQPKAPAWQPIETAPRDGTWILARRSHATRAVILRYDAAYDAFENDDGEHVYHLTHWMPIPAAPQTKEAV